MKDIIQLRFICADIGEPLLRSESLLIGMVNKAMKTKAIEVMMSIVLSGVAFRVFVGQSYSPPLDQTAIEKMAKNAWETGIECVEHEPIGYREVLIRMRQTNEDRSYGLSTRSANDPSKFIVNLINIDPYRGNTLAHEIGHAWGNSSDHASIAEGKATLIADCMVRLSGTLVGHFQKDDKPILHQMVNLKLWDPQSSVFSVEQSIDSYNGLLRYFKAVSLVIPMREIFIPDKINDWNSLEKVLMSSGMRADPLIDFIHQNQEQQLYALSDIDLDGVSAIEEAIIGTKDHLWDSDGDGWWDGQVPILNSVPMLRGGGWTCVGTTEGEQIKFAYSGYEYVFASVPAPLVQVDDLEPVLLEQNVKQTVGAGRRILIAQQHQTTNKRGGLAVKVLDGELNPDPNCVSTSRLLLIYEDDLARKKNSHRELLDYFKYAGDRIDAFIGSTWSGQARLYVSQHRVSPDVGVEIVDRPWPILQEVGTEDFIRNIYLSSDVLADIHSKTEFDYLLSIIYVLSRMETYSITAAEALARESMSYNGALLFAQNHDQINLWVKAALACPAGWRGIVDNQCGRLP